MAKGNGGLSPESAEFVADVLDAALHGAGLTRRLLVFARRGKLDSTDVEINDLVGGIFGLIRCTLGEDISIATELARDVWAVHADAAQFEAAIVNLATNARDAVPNGGRLMISTGNQHLDADYSALHAELIPGDYAMVQVTDTGTGIAPETHLRAVFHQQGSGQGHRARR